MMAKDFLVFIKHRGWLIMSIMLTLNLLALLVFFAYQLKSISHYQFFIELLYKFQTVAMFYPVMMTLGLTWAGFKYEGKTWWLLKSTPTSPNLLLHSRLLVATLCATIYANLWMLLGLNFFKAPLGLWLPTLGVTTLVTATAPAFNTALGALPWVAEIGAGGGGVAKKPVLRIITLAGGIIANVTIVVTSATTTKFVLLALVWVVSYFAGREFLKRLLAR